MAIAATSARYWCLRGGCWSRRRKGLDVGWHDGCGFGPQPNGYEQLTRDIRDVNPEDLDGFHAVIHLAAISNDPIGHLNPEATYDVNTHGAVHMAKTAKAVRSGRSPTKSAKSQALRWVSPRVRGPDTRNYKVDLTKIRSQVPAFAPQWTILQGINEIWSDARVRGSTTEDFEGPQYVRPRQIQQLAAEGRLISPTCGSRKARRPRALAERLRIGRPTPVRT